MNEKRFTGIISASTPRIIRETFYAMAEVHGSASGLTFIGGSGAESARLSYNYAAVYTLGGISTLILRVLTEGNVYIPISGGCMEVDIRYCTLSQLSTTIDSMRRKYERIVVETGTDDTELLAAVTRYFACRIVTPSGFAPIRETMPVRHDTMKKPYTLSRRVG